MKILKIELQNINSLKSPVPIVIDFEAPAFDDVGLFAITGSTGAGKTTILDAITIALYRQVPRFNKSHIKGGLKDVVSYGANEALSRVTFSVKNIRYEAQWDIRLKSKNGKVLTTPIENVIFKNLAKEKILAESKKEFDKAIEEITQLNYDQFLRSVMLAQGEFAAFLSAKPSEKGKLLEQITGEEIYKKIGEAIGNKRYEENDTLKEIKGKINTEDLLTEEQLADLDKTSIENTKALEGLAPQFEQIDQVLLWYQKEAQLQTDKQKLDNDFANLADKKQQHDQVAQQLKTHDLAMPYKEQVTEINQLQENLRQKRARFPELRKESKEIDEKAGKATDQEQSAKKSLAEAEKESKEWNPKLEEVAKLDAVIDQQTIEKEQQDKKLKTVDAQLTELTISKQKHQQQQINIEEELKKAKEFLEEKKVLTAIAPLISDWNAQLNLRKTKTEDLQELQRQIANDQNDLADKTQQYATQKEALEQQLLIVEQLTAQQQKLTADIGATDLRKLIQKRDELQQRQEALKEGKRLLEELTTIQNKQAIQQGLITKCQVNIAGLTPEIAAAEEALADAEKILQLEKQIQSAEEERKKLIAGEPCHVCGSVHHPFVEDYQPASLSESEQKIQIRKESLAALQQKLQDEKTHLLSGESLQTELADQLKSANAALEAARQTFDGLPPGKKLTNLEELQAAMEKNNNAFQELNEDIKRQEKIQKDQYAINEQVEHQKEKRDAIKEVVSRLEEQLKSKNQNLEQYSKKLSEISKTIEQITSDLTENFEAFQLKLPAVEKSEAFIKAIEGKISEYQQQEKRSEQLINQLSQLKISIDSDEKNILEKEKENTEGKSSYDQLVTGLQQNTTQRTGILPAGISTDVKRTELQAAVDTTRKIADNSAAELQLLRDQQNNLKQELSILEKEGKDVKQKLTAIEEALTAAIDETVFENISQVAAALMSYADEQAARTILRELENEELELNSKLSQWQSSQEEQVAAGNSDLSLEEAKEAKQNLNTLKDEYNKALGSIREKLALDNQIRKRNEEVLTAIEAQQKIVDKWATLLKLIGGSKDAFNTYVQRLTLQNLIHLANLHLFKLNKRYSLEMEAEYSQGEELNFKLVDHYQADDKRLIDTSSGGEKFLISLSLALGLSDLSSHNVSVGSLFIDEGFGTLDSRTLETVIATLETLQAQGKMIGIISHVENLKERITTQIQVIKKNNGVSEVVIE